LTETRSGGPLVQRLRFDAGALSLDLLATIGRRYGTPVERLTGLEQLQAWIAGVGLDVGGPLEDVDLDRVRSFREDLNGVFRAVLASQPPDAAALASLNEAAARLASIRVQLSRDGVVLAGSEVPSVERVLGRVAIDAINVLTGPAQSRVRECDAPDCRMLYHSRSAHDRRWCYSRQCGNRSRVASHRSRRQPAESATTRKASTL
jgi:predicted RNA-binding Zn ribbon-like protein